LDSDPVPWLRLLLVAVLLGFNALFVAAEFAFVKVRSSRIQALAEDGNLRAKFARRIMSNVNAYLFASQLGMTMVSIALVWLGEPAVAVMLDSMFGEIMPALALHAIAFIIAYILIAAFHMIVGKQLPKMFAVRKSEPITLWLAAPMVMFYNCMKPFIWLLNGASNWLLRRFGVQPEEDHESAHTEEEIRILMQKSHKSGMINNTEFTLVDNIFEFAETNAREIMIPRTEMICLYAGRSYEENEDIAIREMRTRYPVCDPDKDNIIGYVHIKDFLQNDQRKHDLRSLIRPALSVPESMSLTSLLRLMQKKKTKLALLIDEYGGTSGLVTDGDIIEEIVGEMRDEFNMERPNIELIAEDTYSVNGLVLIEEINDFLGSEIDNTDYDTIGGWMYSQVEIPPRVEQRLLYEGFEFVIEEVDHIRVSRLKIRRLQPNETILPEEDVS